MKAFIPKNQSLKLWERCRFVSNILNFNSVFESKQEQKITAIKMSHDGMVFTILEFSLEEFAEYIRINIDCLASSVNDGMLSSQPQLETKFIDLLFKQSEPVPEENGFKIKGEDYIHL